MIHLTPGLALVIGLAIASKRRDPDEMLLGVGLALLVAAGMWLFG